MTSEARLPLRQDASGKGFPFTSVFDADRQASAFPGRQRILLVDDDYLSRKLLRDILTLRHEVLAVSDGRAALAINRLERFDAVILDLVLPGLDGLEVLRQIRREQGTSGPGQVVVVTTALPATIVEDQAISAGADWFFAKPLRLTAFVPQMELLLAARRMEMGAE